MDTRTRALLGAVLGAVLVLILHPLPRPWLQYGFWKFGHPQALVTNKSLIRNLEYLPDPTEPAIASQWMLTGAGMLNQKRSLSQNQLLLLVEVAREQAEREPANGYWRQCEAIFQRALGNDLAMRRAWSKAAHCSDWDDYQAELLSDALQSLANESGRSMAWHSAVLYHYRSSDVPGAVLELGVALLGSEPTVENRLDSIRNGSLVRDRARSAIGGEFGHELVEYGASGIGAENRGQREMTHARFSFIAELAELGRNDDAVFVSRTLSENEAWEAYVMPSNREKQLEQLQTRAALVSSLPGVLSLSALLGFALLFVHKWFERGSWLAVPFKAKWAPYTSVMLGLGMFGLTGLVGPSLWVTIIVAAMAYSPPHTVPQRRPGVWLIWSMYALGFIVLLCLVLNIIGYASPVYSLRSVTSLGGIFSPDINVLGWLVAVVALSVGVMEVHAFKNRTRLGDVLRSGSRAVIGSIAFSSLLLAGLSTPICLYLDVRTNDVLVKIVYNEPGYHLTVK
ncbi:hypothetical protein QPK87_07160 [Kamptonema cortianum]|nr:hypothetical protein [Geitlerinema splendidum]MDK3156353.1 hypothetical protein [Kamptonema cortianum]